jgi:hypothetical protein
MTHAESAGLPVLTGETLGVLGELFQRLSPLLIFCSNMVQNVRIGAPLAVSFGCRRYVVPESFRCAGTDDKVISV